MDFKKFLEFPGILILVGALLLIVVLIISLVASKKSKKNKEQNIPLENQPSVTPEPVVEQEINQSFDENVQNVTSSVVEPSINQVTEDTVAMEFQNELNNTSNQVEQPTNTWGTPTSIYGGVSPTEGIKIDNPVKENGPYEEKNFVVSEAPSIPLADKNDVEIPTIITDTSKEVEIDNKEEEIETL